MPVVVFETPGLIDIRSFTTFGFNSKPASVNPIGFFGTGLKYAVAVLAREKIPVQLFIGPTEYQFTPETTTFRGKEFSVIRMSRRHGWRLPWQHETLPFTTELGKTWKLWQAFRELESNTRDEGGLTALLNGPGDREDTRDNVLNADRTWIVVGGEAFAEEYLKRDEIFLPEHDLHFVGGGVQIVKRPSKHLYYRGMRVADLTQPSIYTYNIHTWIELTEDRTIKWMFSALARIAETIAKSDDEQVIAATVKASDAHMEHRLEWSMSGVVPGQTFLDVMQRMKQRRDAGRITSGALSYYNTYTPRTLSPHRDESYRDKIIRLVKDGDFDELVELIDSDREKFLMLLGKEETKNVNGPDDKVGSGSTGLFNEYGAIPIPF